MYNWLECSSSLRVSSAGGATQEDVLRLSFIADRVEDGRLDAKVLEEMWDCHIGYDFLASVNTFYAFRQTVIRQDIPFETDEEDLRAHQLD